jgi:glycine/D-amino acid oxidase-like deaminating enzyme
MTDHSVIVIGGGFYGALVALMLRERGCPVVLLEQEDNLMERASLRNQARVHGGYHYPRSLMTAFRSRVNYPRFVEDFRECIYDRFEHIYAVARRFSKIGARQFRMFMERIGSPLKPVPAHLAALMRSAMVEDAWVVEEVAFNATALRGIISERLRRADVEVRLATCAESVHTDGDTVIVRTESSGVFRDLRAGHVFDCTYGALNRLRTKAGWTRIPVKHELAEMCLVEVPPELGHIGLTVMCGPFFSLFPYPARENLYTLSHVRYTPHLSWDQTAELPRMSPAELARRAGRESAFPLMVRDAARYLPAIAGCRFVDSIWEIKSVLPQNEGDDGRPILFNPAPECPRFVSVMGGKLDNVYDLPRELDGFAA